MTDADPAHQTRGEVIWEFFKIPDRPMWFVTGAFLIFSLFGFSGGVVGGDRESYSTSVAMLNAKTKMAKDLGSVREEVSKRTKEIQRLQRLLAPNTDNDPERGKFQKAVHDLARDVHALNAEIDKARNLGASDVDLARYQPDKLVPLQPAPAYEPVKFISESEVLSERRRRAVPIINGPADPSGAWASYQQVASEVRAYNEQDLPGYKQARESVRYTIYRSSGLEAPDAILLADLVLSAGMRESETDAEILNVLTAARAHFQNAHDQVTCLNLILAFGQWLRTSQGRDSIRKLLTTYVTTPTGFVETPNLTNAIEREFPGVQPGRAENFAEQLRAHRAWEQQIQLLMSDQRSRFRVRPEDFYERFNESATSMFGRLLAGACSVGMTAEEFEAHMSQLANATPTVP